MNLMSKQEVSEMLGCKESTVSYYVYSKQIPFIMIGKEVKFKRSSVEERLNQREAKPTFE